ncbi:MAG: DMT family transporter [Candidatus Zeuxoniibacter abyssi]|nr:MAG: DMT family transporter [Candidatus Persebacteraceae bacterium AB1(2)]
MMLRPIHFIALLVINAAFGGAYLAGKAGVAHFPPLFFSALRFALVTVLLAPFIRLSPGMRKQKTNIMLFCLFMGVGVYSTMYLALHYADGVSVILICTQFSVPVSSFLGIWLLKERPSKKIWFGIWLAFAGVMAAGFDYAILGYWPASLLILLSATFYAGANALSRRLRNAINVLNLNAWMGLISTPILLAASLLLENGHWESLATADITDWSALLYSAIIVSLIGHVGMFSLLRHYPLSAVMPYYVLTPIFGIIGGILMFDETLSLRFLLCATVALIGVYIVNRAPHSAHAFGKL